MNLLNPVRTFQLTPLLPLKHFAWQTLDAGTFAQLSLLSQASSAPPKKKSQGSSQSTSILLLQPSNPLEFPPDVHLVDLPLLHVLCGFEVRGGGCPSHMVPRLV